MSEPTLLVLAAGMGSRYGGLKQLEGVGPNGETIMDYSIYDAIRAGFAKVVFVIRRDFEEEFKTQVGSKYEGRIQVHYVFQDLADIPEGFSIPEGRKKPWGTAHATWIARECLTEPFGIINADDFYGKQSFEILGNYLRTLEEAQPEGDLNEYGMVGFELRHTLSDHGHVTRGICQANDQGYLEAVVETEGIEKSGENGAKCPNPDGSNRELTGDEVASMNLWAFPTEFLEHLGPRFEMFLREQGQELKSEFFLPVVVNDLINDGEARVKVLHSPESWFGVTYQEDRPMVEQGLQSLIQQGVYPQKLWG